MEAYQHGDVAAFAELVERYEQPLWSFLRRFVGDAATAEDLLQETFLRVVRGAGDWKREAKFSTWLYTIARNLCTDHARRSAFRSATSLDDAGALSSGAPGADGALLDREIAARIDRAVADLPLEQREVFLMREVMELPFAEIARAVGASEPTVKSRMRYALERLRAALDELRDAGGAASVERAGQAT